MSGAPADLTIRRALAAEEALRRLQVPAKSVVVQEVAQKLAVIARHEQEILLVVGPIPEGDWRAAYREATTWRNDAPKDELDAFWSAYKNEIDAVIFHCRLEARRRRTTFS